LTLFLLSEKYKQLVLSSIRLFIITTISCSLIFRNPTTMPSVNKAAWISEAKADFSVGSAPYPPNPGPQEILVKNLSIATNPVEAKIQKFAMFPLEYPNILGSSFAGTIEAVGPEVDVFKIGDRVVVQKGLGPASADPKYGVYQQYALAKTPYVSKLEDKTSLDDASASIANVATVVAALTLVMGLERPLLSAKSNSIGKKLLVYGGSTSLGGLAIQYASQAGYIVVTTSSPKNKAAVKAAGPAKIIDHTQSTEEIAESLKAEGPFDYVFETVGTPLVVSLIAKQLESQGGGVIFSVMPALAPEDLGVGVERKFFPYSSLLEEEANDELRKWLYDDYLPKGLATGKIIPTKVEKLPGGLSALQSALDRHLSGSVSGVKLVVDPSETP
jgi:NADPH:quinone reductase-like Zn-dependent oxidoreductase